MYSSLNIVMLQNLCVTWQKKKKKNWTQLLRINRNVKNVDKVDHKRAAEWGYVFLN